MSGAKTPFGFFVAGACAAWFGFWMVMVVLYGMNPADDGVSWTSSPLGRGAASVLAALSAVVAEALWRARPWAWRASVALAVVYAAAVLAVSATVRDGVGTGLTVLLASSVVVGPILAYVRGRSRNLWPPARARARPPVPAPRRPAGVPAAARGAARP
ncbi:MAG TPA: hypothetical protein VFJ82_11920 [Longimicrobium sp.]|nr:hypothetical protein [Longimicrobium sp.]